MPFLLGFLLILVVLFCTLLNSVLVLFGRRKWHNLICIPMYLYNDIIMLPVIEEVLYVRLYISFENSY